MKAEPKVAVILFPGTNCELEALRTCRRAKMKADLIRWNTDYSKLKNYDAFIIPGGFSYEDRGRSGIVAAKDPIMHSIAKEALKGKPVLGICNGAQILVETGLIPGIKYGKVNMALTNNQRIKKGKNLGRGFYNDWIHIRSEMKKGRSPFNNFSSKTVLHIPLAHAEGRFTMDQKQLTSLIKKKQTLFRYCNAKGEFIDEFPTNPNGAIYNLAGVCNKEGNVLSLMPHPERTMNGQPIFDSLAQYLRKNTKKLTTVTKLPVPMRQHHNPSKFTKKADISITVKLIITDNEERTIEDTAHQIGLKHIQLEKQNYYRFFLKNKGNLKEIATKIIESGELLNLNKEVPTITIKEKQYRYEADAGLKEDKAKKSLSSQFFVIDQENYDGKRVQAKLCPYLPQKSLKKVEKGTLWDVKTKKPREIDALIDSHILHNPHAMKIVALQ